ncbi:DUF6304 family protein [Streptomyces sp. t39]|uniref:DUF6304 family protein n=1 Tax=Streptomyces sp. t39 TaxID=1828156 RepID=UPI0011CE20DC|nr:DUF6304 family protein [Streptomyces sp. t39]TXS56861.1 hypothetical protein EAO77_12680 [Streptomyces sp. t39]
MSSESTEAWAGWYRDRAGAEAVAITATGGQVSTRIRGVEYTGATFAALRSEGGALLSSCVLEWDMPLPVVLDGAVQHATLGCLLTLGEPAGGGAGLDRSDLSLTLHHGGAAYEVAVADGDFDDALGRIDRQLPPGAGLVRREPAEA